MRSLPTSANNITIFISSPFLTTKAEQFLLGHEPGANLLNCLSTKLVTVGAHLLKLAAKIILQIQTASLFQSIMDSGVLTSQNRGSVNIPSSMCWHKEAFKRILPTYSNDLGGPWI